MKINKSTLRQLPFMAPIFLLDYEILERGTGYGDYGNRWYTANLHGLMATAQRRAELVLEPSEWTTDNFWWRKSHGSSKVFVGDVHDRVFFQSGLVKLLGVPRVTPGFPVLDIWEVNFEGMPDTAVRSDDYADDNYTEDYGDDQFEATYAF